MSINRYDTYQPFEYPIEAMLKMGQIAEQRSDRGNDAMDKFQAALSSVTPAPGHEDYAKEVVGKYYTQAQELVNSGIRPEDPRFLGGLRKMTYQLANDPDIKNIQTSKKYYDEIIAKTLPEVRAKAGINYMPGVIEPGTDKFIQNRSNYNNYNYYVGDYNKEIDEQFAKVKERIEQDPSGFRAYKYQDKENPNNPLNGHWVTKTSSGEVRKWIDDDVLEATKQSVKADFILNPSSTQNRLLFWHTPGNDENTLDRLLDLRKEPYKMLQRTRSQGSYNLLDAGTKKEEDSFLYSLSGTPMNASNKIADSYSLKKRVEDINKQIPVMEAEIANKTKSGLYPADSPYLLDLNNRLSVLKETSDRYNKAYINEMEKASSSLTKEERLLYEKYKNYQFPAELSMTEIQQIRNSDIPEYKELNKGLLIVDKVVNDATKNVAINRMETVIPGILLSSDKKANEQMDDFVNRAVVSTTVYDPITMQTLTDKDVEGYSTIKYGGYTRRPVGSFGRMLAVQYKDKDGKLLKTGYMQAPQNFKEYLTSINRGDGEELDIQDQLVLIKDNPLLPGGNIIIDGKNYGRLEVPSRISPKKVQEYDANPDLIFWRAPDGKLHSTDIITLARTIRNIRKNEE